MSVLETSTEKWGNNYAKSIGYIQMKVSPMGQRGWNDQLYINENGVHVWVEYKREGETARKLQQFRHQQLRDRHVPVYTDVATRERIKEILDEWRHADTEYF